MSLHRMPLLYLPYAFTGLSIGISRMRWRDLNVVSWNAMILGRCFHGCPANGLTLVVKMVGQGSSTKPGAKTTSKYKRLTAETTDGNAEKSELMLNDSVISAETTDGPAVSVDGFGSEAKFQKDSVENSEYKPFALVDDVKVESDSTSTSVFANEDSLTNRNGGEKLISEAVGGLQEDSTAASLVTQWTLMCWTAITLGHWIWGYLAALGFFHQLFCAAAVALQQPVALLKPVLPASQANKADVAVRHTLLPASQATKAAVVVQLTLLPASQATKAAVVICMQSRH